MKWIVEQADGWNSGHTDEQTRQKIDIKKLYPGINSKRYYEKKKVVAKDLKGIKFLRELVAFN